MSAPVLGNLVDGRWSDGATGDLIDVLDPADQRVVVARVPAMGRAEIETVYASAARAVGAWWHGGGLARAAVLTRAADLLRERTEEIATDLVREMGKTLAEATVETTKAADFFDYYAGLARLPYGSLLEDARPGTLTSSRTEPVGVVLAITPWNDPLLTPARKLAPALAAGNAVVLKPATDTPVVALHLARALADAGLPAGVLSTVTGRARDVSDALLRDPRLAAVTFTGSTEVGMGLRATLADTNVRLQTEMGGKNATAVLADADLDLAARTVAAAAFGQAGQRCTATSRLVVDEEVADELLERLVAAVGGLRLGPGLDPGTTMGPVVNQAQQQEVLGHLERARGEGARVAAGGGRPAEPELAHGCFVQPTVLDGVTPEMAIWREEVFGPALAVRRVSGFAAAVEAVNDSVYGLSAAVFTQDVGRAHRFVDLAEAGQVSVNLPTSGWDVHHPFGGFALSGSPFKEQGTEGLRFYTRVKTVAMGHSTENVR